MLVLGSTWGMCVTLTTGSLYKGVNITLGPLDNVLEITAEVGKIDGIFGQRILWLYSYWRQFRENLSQGFYFILSNVIIIIILCREKT